MEDEKYWKEREYVKELVDQIPAAIFWKNTESVFLGCNKNFAEFASLPSTEAIIGKTDYDMPWERYQSDAYREDDQQVIKSKTPKLNIEETQTLLDGSKIVLLTNKSPLFAENGKVVGILGIFHDITDRKKMEFALQKAKDAAEYANRSKSEFIANMSHDLRTPLVGMIGVAEIIANDTRSEEERKYARMIRDGGNELLGILNHILNAIVEDKFHTESTQEESFDLRALVEGLRMLMTPAMTSKGIDLKIAIDPAVPERIVCDREKLKSALLNLIGNAIKFTDKGYVELQVMVREQAGGKFVVEFSVIDTGVGIPKDKIDRIFDQFYRVNPASVSKYPGSGLGLYLVKKFVEALGSEIKVTSEVGKGTTFYFSLPTKAGTIEAAERDAAKRAQKSFMLAATPLPERSPVPTPPALTLVEKDKHSFKPLLSTIKNTPPSDRLHALLVEDNLVIQDVNKKILTQIGHTLIIVPSAEEALELVKQDKFDVIFTDIGLPGMDGKELTTRIRNWEKTIGKPRIPIIGITADTMGKVGAECLKSGMDAVVGKPLSLESARNILRQLALLPQPATQKPPAPKKINTPVPPADEKLFQLKSTPLFDFNIGMKTLGGNKRILKDILQVFVEKSIPTSVTELHDAYEKKDWRLIQKIAHRERGGAIYCGAMQMAKACQHFEEYFLADRRDLLDNLYEQMTDVLVETQYHIKDWLVKQK